MTELPMDKNMYFLEVRHTWFSDAFSKQKITFSSEDSSSHVWELREKLSERYIRALGKAEAISVFEVVQIHGPAVGQVAILKIHMQAPFKRGTHFNEDPKIRAHLAGDEPFPEGTEEIRALEYLTDSKCTVSPKLLGSQIDKQDETMWVPGGYIIYTLMEKLPGRNIHDFYEWPREKRDELRAIFLESLAELIRLGLEPMDAGLRNILWDDASKKCYIIDYEAWMHSQDTALGPDGRVAHPIRTLVYWQLIYGTGPDYEW